MTTLELLTEEIRLLFPPIHRQTQREFLETNQYTVHCSRVFSESLKKTFLSMGFLIPTSINEEDIKEGHFTKYQIPNAGVINVIEDMEQGYKIERIDV